MPFPPNLGRIPFRIRRPQTLLHWYVSIAKFIDLLEAKTLFLPKATILPDKAEGLKCQDETRS